jgi:hypothetical protein
MNLPVIPTEASCAKCLYWLKQNHHDYGLCDRISDMNEPAEPTRPDAYTDDSYLRTRPTFACNLWEAT